MLTQIPTAFNIEDIGTKCLAKKRLLALMGEAGMFFVESREQVGQTEQSELVANGTSSKTMTKLAKTLLRLTVVMGLEPGTVTAQEEICKSDAKHVRMMDSQCMPFWHCCFSSGWFLHAQQFGFGKGYK